MRRHRRASLHTLTLLDALTQRPRAWHYGYDLSRLTKMKSGTLYPILMRLSERGVLESKWQPAVQEGRPPRHMYRLTAAGLVFARDSLAAQPAGRRLESPGEYA
ncbi:MAG: PadR family transcriptional regulator [Steroidobacteraceae bacterium]